MSKIFKTLPAGLAIILALLNVTGCGNSGKATAPPPLAIEQVPQTLESAFKSAPAEANQAANEAITSVRNEEPEALTELQDLSSRPELSEEQRVAAARAMAAYLKKLRESAEKGDKKSEEAIEHYRATK